MTQWRDIFDAETEWDTEPTPPDPPLPEEQPAAISDLRKRRHYSQALAAVHARWKYWVSLLIRWPITILVGTVWIFLTVVMCGHILGVVLESDPSNIYLVGLWLALTAAIYKVISPRDRTPGFRVNQD